MARDHGRLYRASVIARASTLAGLLDGTAGRLPDVPALLGEDGSVLTYAGLAAASRRVGGGLAALGVGPGDRVAVWLPNGPAYPVLVFALARLGACAVHLSTRASAAELAALLGRARPVAVAGQWGFGVDFGATLEAALADLRAPVRAVIGVGEGAPDRVDGLRVIPWATLDGTPERMTDDADPEAAALTFTTSGTTGLPKLALHRARSIAAHARDVAAALDLREGRVAMVPVPFCGAFGMTLAMAAWAGGATVLAPARADPAALATAIRDRGVTHWVTGDDLLARVLDAAGEVPFEGLRFTGFASFHPGAEAVARRADAMGLRPRALYGASEVQAVFSVAEDPHRFVPGGTPVSPAASVTADEEGVLSFSGPSLFHEYLGDPGATAAVLRDGAFRSSDLGTVRDGGFTFLGRRDDALRLSGFLVQPAEIEAVLEGVPGVTGAVVVGADGGTRAVAFVRGGEPDALRAACEAALPRHKRPALIAPMDSLPVADGPNGAKLRRRDLREVADRLLAEAASA